MKRSFPITLELSYQDQVMVNSTVSSPLLDFDLFIKDIKRISVNEGYVLVNVRGVRYDELVHSQFPKFEIKGRVVFI